MANESDPAKADGAPISAMLDRLLRTMGLCGISRPQLAAAMVGRDPSHPTAYLEAAAAITGDIDIGLTLAQRTPVEVTTSLAYLLMSSPTLGVAIEHLERYVGTVERRPT